MEQNWKPSQWLTSIFPAQEKRCRNPVINTQPAAGNEQILGAGDWETEFEIAEESTHEINLNIFLRCILLVYIAYFMYYPKCPWSIMFLTVNGKSVLLYWENGWNIIICNEYNQAIFAMIIFPITDSCSHFSGYFYTTKKDKTVSTISLIREETLTLWSNLEVSFQGSLLLSSQNHPMHSMFEVNPFYIWQAKERKKKKKKNVKKAVLLNSLSPDVCIEFTDWFSNHRPYLD